VVEGAHARFAPRRRVSQPPREEEPDRFVYGDAPPADPAAPPPAETGPAVAADLWLSLMSRWTGQADSLGGRGPGAAGARSLGRL